MIVIPSTYAGTGRQLRQIVYLFLGCLMVTGCASTMRSEPGTYTFQITMQGGTPKSHLYGDFDYTIFLGDFRIRGDKQQRRLFRLTEFYPLRVEWITASGIKRKEQVDVKNLVMQARQETKFPDPDLSAILLIAEINQELFSIRYYHYKYLVRPPVNDRTALVIYTSSVNSS